MTLQADIQNDLATFLADFGVSATYNGTTQITGIFETDYRALDEDGMEIRLSGPIFYARTADVPADAQGKVLAVAGVNYTIVGVQPDGTGMTLLTLSRI